MKAKLLWALDGSCSPGDKPFSLISRRIPFWKSDLRSHSPQEVPLPSKWDGFTIYSGCYYYLFVHFSGLRQTWQNNHQALFLLMDHASAAKTMLPPPQMPQLYPRIDRNLLLKTWNQYQNRKYQATSQSQTPTIITHSPQSHSSSGKRPVHRKSTKPARKTSTVG